MAQIDIGGRLHSTATGNVIAGANEVLDDTLNKKQNEVNDISINQTYRKSETYNKEELNQMITTPNQKFVSISATSETTSITDILPAEGEKDTIYRVGNWDGTAYTTDCYTEYAWNGSDYVPLSTKEPGIDDKPIPDSDNLVKSGGVAKIVYPTKEAVTGILNIEIPVMFSNGIIQADGTIVAPGNGHYHYTNEIVVEPGDIYEATNLSAYATTSIVAMYNSSSVFDSSKSIKGNGKNPIFRFTIPEGIKYIRLCYSDNAFGDTSEPVLTKIGIFDDVKEEAYSYKNKDYIGEHLKYSIDIPKRKPCISFAFDCRDDKVRDGKGFEFSKKLIANGLYPTFFPLDTQLVNGTTVYADNISDLKKLQKMGCEIAVHSVPADRFGKDNVVQELKLHPDYDPSSSDPAVNYGVPVSEEVLRTKLQTRILPNLVKYGFFPMGWTTSHGTIYSGGTIYVNRVPYGPFPKVDLTSVLKEFFVHGITTATSSYNPTYDDGTHDGFNPNYVNYYKVTGHADDDPMALKRWAIETTFPTTEDCVRSCATEQEIEYLDSLSGAERVTELERLAEEYSDQLDEAYNDILDTRNTNVIKAAKKGIDTAIETNGLFVVYCHSYEAGGAYTLTEEVLDAILEYVKPLMDGGKILGGTNAEVVKYYFNLIKSDIATLEAAVATNASDIKKNVLEPLSQQEKYVKRYYNNTGDLVVAGATSWYATRLMLLSQIGTSIVIHGAYRRYYASDDVDNVSKIIPYIVFFDTNKSFLSCLVTAPDEETPVSGNIKSFDVTISSENIPEGAVYFACTLTANGYVEGITSAERTKKYLGYLDTELLNKYKLATISINKHSGWCITKSGNIVNNGSTTWHLSDYIPVSYFDKTNNLEITGTLPKDISIVLNKVINRYSSNIPYVVFCDIDKNVIGYIEDEDTTPNVNKTKNTLTITSSDIPDGTMYIVVNFQSDGSLGNYETLMEKAAYGNSKFAVSWIDDDFYITPATKVKEICDNLGCKCDFALKEDGVTETNLSSYIKPWQLEGFHFQLHPVHDGWYGDNYQGQAYCEQKLLECMDVFDNAGIRYAPCLVYPGGQFHDEAFMNMVQSHLEYAFTSGVNAKDQLYNEGIVNPLRLARMFIRLFGQGAKTVQEYKDLIDEAYDAGAWVIIGTHSWQFADTADESHAAWADLLEIVSYANSKSTIQPVQCIWNKRKIMLGLYSR